MNMSDRSSDMSDLAVIEADGLSKNYRLWSSPSSRIVAPLLYRGGKLLSRVSAFGGALMERSHNYYSDVAALKDVSFRVQRGESVALIGTNGSGKSTLLQILAGTLTPSSGQATVRGKVAALLELGSAFNPEFTGEENIYLNASMLGMGRSDIEEIYDDVVSFSDIGAFIKEPVKTYSSGMALRLAFAVQTAVRPDLLIVDEALSVGDVFFQAKCIRKIRKMLDDGVTLLYVSHSMSSVKEICSRGILLERGQCVFDGSSGKAVDHYFIRQKSRDSQAASREIAADDEDGAKPPEFLVNDGVESFEGYSQDERVTDGRGVFRNIQIRDSAGERKPVFTFGEEAVITMSVDVHADMENILLGYHIRTKTGIDIIHGDSRLTEQGLLSLKSGDRYCFEWRIPLNLQHGDYYIMAFMSQYNDGNDWKYVDMLMHAADFSVAPRSQGMIGGYVVIADRLEMTRL